MDGAVPCPSCQTENAAGSKFCSECGTALARSCTSCGALVAPTAKFCAECGSALAGTAAPAAPAPAPTPVAERRLVTVLFADLVGFTSQSESRDAEETRELLSLYFETARNVIERYGGRVEKFIGDAVMALWGAPVAQEDDAERGVRAALELVSAVEGLGADVRVRAGVLTGEAAVTIGAEGEGMVAGDLVNTASRVQSAAEPGTVLVGDSTRRASDAAIAYEDGGIHEVKGKTEPLQLWRALRVIANRGGEGRSAGLEPPFVGRDRELRLVKELFHASAEEEKAHLALRRRRRRDRQVAPRVGVREVHRRAGRERAGGTRAAASRTATRSPTGRSRRWCACEPGSARTSRPTARRRSSPQRSSSSSPIRRSAPSSSHGCSSSSA